MTMKSRIAILFILSWFLCPGIFADETLKEIPIDSDTGEFILDEVVVKGDSSLSSLREEVIRAEELQFETFNSLNSRDDFDIKCTWRAPTGSLFERQRCDVEFMRRQKAIDAYMYLTRGHPYRSEAQLAIEYAGEFKELKKEMIDLTYQYPELAAAMIRAVKLQKLFEAERRKRFKDSKLRYLAGMGDDPETDENDIILNEFDYWQRVFKDHSKGAVQDEVWERWDSWCRNKIHSKYYQKLWDSKERGRYAPEFIAYVNTIISGE